MVDKKKRLISVLLFLLMSLLFVGCLSTQSGGSSNVIATPNILVETTMVAIPIEGRTITPTNSPTTQVTSHMLTATQTPPPVMSLTTTPMIPDTKTTQPVDPLPLSWIALIDSISMDLVVIQTNGMGRRPIVESVRYPSDPKWSPDGQWIAFLGSPNSPQIFLVRPDGSELKQLTFTPGYKNSLSWSPDGQSIVYSQGFNLGDSQDRQYEVDLFVYEIKTSQVRQITNTQGTYEHAPIYSPMGDTIGFLSVVPKERSGFFKIMALDLVTNTTWQLIDTPLNIGSWDWSPDGSQIAFVSSGTEASAYACNAIYLVNTDGSGLQQLTSSQDAHYASLSWHTDGKWIIFTKARCNYPAAPGFNDIYAMHLTKNEVILIPGTHKSWSPDWSPWPAIKTGQRLYITQLGANLKLRLSPSLSGEARKKLKEGDAITVLEGPIEADEYLWWRVSVNNGEDEGWIAENPGWFSGK